MSKKPVTSRQSLRYAFPQLAFMTHELGLIVNRRWWRWFTMWFGGSAGVIVSYRLDRFFYLVFGNLWSIFRVLFFPIFLFFRILSVKHEISYKADIGRGFMVLHPSLGLVVSGKTVTGERLIMTGGNCIGSRGQTGPGDLQLGDNVTMGANAVILGPLTLGNNIMVGAGAVVVDSAEDGSILVGVPARPKR